MLSIASSTAFPLHRTKAEELPDSEEKEGYLKTDNGSEVASPVRKLFSEGSLAAGKARTVRFVQLQTVATVESS